VTVFKIADLGKGEQENGPGLESIGRCDDPGGLHVASAFKDRAGLFVISYRKPQACLIGLFTRLQPMF